MPEGRSCGWARRNAHRNQPPTNPPHPICCRRGARITAIMARSLSGERIAQLLTQRSPFCINTEYTQFGGEFSKVVRTKRTQWGGSRKNQDRIPLSATGRKRSGQRSENYSIIAGDKPTRGKEVAVRTRKSPRGKRLGRVTGS